MDGPERHLPQELLDRASLRGNELAWRIPDIPLVIEAARNAGLINIGGQLQFRIPNRGTCECYWVEVDTYQSVPTTLPWAERVRQTADVALTGFARLASDHDFLQEGRRGFPTLLQELEEQGGDPADAMCFVWYVAEPEPPASQHSACKNARK
jgi:hypothetical protein